MMIFRRVVEWVEVAVGEDGSAVAPCPPEFSSTDQGWRVNPEDVSPTHQSNITPVEPRGEAKSVSTFFS